MNIIVNEYKYVLDFLMAAINLPFAVRGFKINIAAFSFCFGVGMVHLIDTLK